VETPASTPSPQRLHRAGTAAGCTDGQHLDPQEHDAQPRATPSRAARGDDAGARVSALTSLQVGSVISYVIAIVIPALDAVIPVLPSESVIIALGVATAGSADPRIALLVACSALGAFLGDNLSYLLGRRFGPRVERRFFRGEKGVRRRAWAERSLQRFGMQLIVVCRFFPGGRTAVTLCCGIVGYPRRRFVVATAVAGLIWASYSFFIGRLGGKAFEDAPWAGFAVAFGVTIAVSGLVELIRRIVSRRRDAATSGGHPAGPAEADRSSPPVHHTGDNCPARPRG
jgi:membrane-associated protein